jgi:hypothetical protein
MNKMVEGFATNLTKMSRMFGNISSEQGLNRTFLAHLQW